MNPKLLLPFALLSMSSQAQTVRIEYDKINGQVRYSKCVQKDDKTLCRPIDRPKLRANDVVELKVTNVNEFVFRAKTLTRVEKDTTARNFGTGFGAFLGSTQSLFGNLNFGAFDISQMQEAMSGILGMGGVGSMIPDEMERELLPIRSSQSEVEQGMNKIIGEVRAIDGTLEQLKALKFDRTKPLARIRQERDSLVSSLTARAPEYAQEGYALRLDRSLSDHLAAAERLVSKEADLLASLNNTIVMTAPQRKREDIQAVARGFDRASLQSHIDEINGINKELDQARFEYIETITLDNADATAVNMQLEIYDQTQLAEPTTADGVQPGKVVRYFSDRWTTPSGLLTDTLCDGCVPLRAAEGFYFGAPLDPAAGTANNDIYGRSGAYGQWRRWDRNGKLVEEFFIDRPDLAGMVKNTVNSGPVPVLAEKKIFHVPVNRGLILSTSLGVSVTSLMESPKGYETLPDTAYGFSILLENERSNVLPVVSSFFHFHWDGESNVHLGGNMGVGVALSQVASLNVMAGPSLIIGRKQTLVVNAGLSASQVERKMDFLPVGVPFDNSLALGAITEKQWALGYFIGVSFGVGLTGQ